MRWLRSLVCCLAFPKELSESRQEVSQILPLTRDRMTMMLKRDSVLRLGNFSYDLFDSISVPGFDDSVGSLGRGPQI